MNGTKIIYSVVAVVVLGVIATVALQNRGVQVSPETTVKVDEWKVYRSDQDGFEIRNEKHGITIESPPNFQGDTVQFRSYLDRRVAEFFIEQSIATPQGNVKVQLARLQFAIYPQTNIVLDNWIQNNSTPRDAVPSVVNSCVRTTVAGFEAAVCEGSSLTDELCGGAEDRQQYWIKTPEGDFGADVVVLSHKNPFCSEGGKENIIRIPDNVKEKLFSFAAEILATLKFAQ